MEEGLKPKFEYSPKGEPTQKQIASFLSLLKQLIHGVEITDYPGDNSQARKNIFVLSSKLKITITEFLKQPDSEIDPDSGEEVPSYLDFANVIIDIGEELKDRDFMSRTFSVEAPKADPDALYIKAVEHYAYPPNETPAETIARRERMRKIFAENPFSSELAAVASSMREDKTFNQEDLMGLMQFLATLREKK